jgi:rhodanese-related sulfurtransferase
LSGASLRLSQFSLIDVSEMREHLPISDLTVQNIPFSRFELDHPPPLDKERQYLLYCSKGIRSAHLVRELRKRGYDNVFALAGGLARQNLADLRRRELEGASLFYVSH